MAIFDKFLPESSPSVVFAENWRSLEKASLAGKKVVCRLEAPLAQFHDPGFRDLPGLVSLWVVAGPEDIRQASLLGLRWMDKEADESDFRARLDAAPEAGAWAPRTGRSEAPETLVEKGLRNLGLKRARRAGLTVSIFREFVKPPYGGGNQFMLALKGAMENLGVNVLVNEVSRYVDGYYFDSLWFDEKILRKLEKIPNPVVIHRIDGPIHLYRGKDKDIDDKIFAVNASLATSTVIQSDFTLEKVIETGYRPVRPVVIRNAADASIFHPPAIRREPGRKLRVIATSWSDNPNKGGPTYKWLEENLDYDRFEFTFVGRCSEKLVRARSLPAVPSGDLAKLLQEHDLYLTASQNDPCSNALIEALSCGLPAIALRSGGHPELVGQGGLCFKGKEEIPDLLARIAGDYETYRARVSPPRMADVVERYLDLVREP